LYQLLFQYIRITLILSLFFVVSAFAGPSDLTCAELDQTTTAAKPWVCPDIVDTGILEAELADVNFQTGEYTCKYNYKDSHSMATSCSYISSGYKDEIDTKIDDINESVAKYEAVKFNDDYPLGFAADVPAEHSVEEGLIDTLSTMATELVNDLKDSDSSMLGLDGAVVLTYDALLGTIRANSYNELVKPYLTDGNRSKETFSRFITGMITLDPEVVSGYNAQLGELDITEAWTDKPNSVTFWELLKAFIKGESVKHDTVNTDYDGLHDWVSIFKMKIWGFYYNLQRRLDIGYDIIVTQLLFIMMAFFAISATARGGARYITNRESGQSSGEVKINEASIMKTLGVLATVFTFYISVPSDISSVHLQPTEKADLNQHEMRTNDSLAKGFIRYAIKEGSYFGTMMADLGTDAFLEYLVKKQGLYTGLQERTRLMDGLKSMAYYYPELKVAKVCQAYYGLSADRFVTAPSKGQYTLNAEYIVRKDSYPDEKKFLSDNAVEGISFDLCKKVHQTTQSTLGEVATIIAETKEKLDNYKYVRAASTKALVENHVKLQKELGWMNIASVPYTYFMMKNQELFFETSMDYEAIEEKVSQFTSNIGVRNAHDSLDGATWFSQTAENALERVDKADGATKNTRPYTRLAFYNFLPGFTSIRNEIHQRLQGIYSDILRKRRTASKGNTSPSAGTEDDLFKKWLVKEFREAKKYYANSPFTVEYFEKRIKNDYEHPVKLHQLFVLFSYIVAMAIWKSGFIILFLSSIAMIIGIKIVLYVINVLIHFFISPFVVVWAFATSEAGMGKIKGYLRDTLIYMLYPSIIVIGVFVFIFAYELFYSIYAFITSVLIEGQLAAVSQAIAANKPGHTTETKEAMSYLAVYSLRDMTEIFIDLLSVYVAFVTINKFPELVLKMLGLGDSSVIMLPQAVEKVQNQGGGHVSPLSR